MRFLSLLLGLALLVHSLPSHSQSRKSIDSSTDALMFFPVATGAFLSLCKKDYSGVQQLALSGITAATVNYLLEMSITKKRPDGSGRHAFPSTHTVAAFAGATFLQKRYGWRWGIPAYAVASYVGWGRIFSKKHDFWDVAAGAVLGAGASLIYTRPYRRTANIAIVPSVTSHTQEIIFFASF